MTSQPAAQTAVAKTRLSPKGGSFRILGACFASYLCLTFRTAWIEIHNEEILLNALSRGPGIFGIQWHGRLAFSLLFGLGIVSGAFANFRPFRSRFVGLIKPNAEGLLFRECMLRLGIRTADTGPGVGRLARALISEGSSIITSADGPRGPFRQANSAVIRFAALAGGIIVPLGSAASWRLEFRTWDRFILPLPFARIVYVLGEPIELSACADEAAIEDARARLERTLTALAERAESLLHASCRLAPK